jgi:hypothetical protein
MAKKNSLLSLVKENLQNITGTVALVFLVLLVPPLLHLGIPARWEEFSGLAAWVYALITLFTLITIAGAAYIAMEEIQEIDKDRRLNTIFELGRQYATEDMYQALQAVWNKSAEEISADLHLNAQRHKISDFWNMVGWAVKEGLVEIELIHSRFGNAIEVWDKKIKPVEMIVRRPIEKRDNPQKSDEEIEKLAADHVSSLLGTWLYGEFQNHGLLKLKQGVSPR